jgi:hypothetical protein
MRELRGTSEIAPPNLIINTSPFTFDEFRVLCQIFSNA